MFHKLASNKKTHRKKNRNRINKYVRGGGYTLKSDVFKNAPNELLVLTKEMLNSIIKKLCHDLDFMLNPRAKGETVIHNLKIDLCLAIFIESLNFPNTIKVYKDTYEYTSHSYIEYIAKNKNFINENWKLFVEIITIYKNLAISIENIYICIVKLFYYDKHNNIYPNTIDKIITSKNCHELSKHFTNYLNYKDNENNIHDNLDEFLKLLELKYTPNSMEIILNNILNHTRIKYFICNEWSNILYRKDITKHDFKRNPYICKNVLENFTYYYLLNNVFQIPEISEITEISENKPTNNIVKSELKETKTPRRSLFSRILSRKHSIKGGKKRTPYNKKKHTRKVNKKI